MKTPIDLEHLVNMIDLKLRRQKTWTYIEVQKIVVETTREILKDSHETVIPSVPPAQTPGRKDFLG